MISPKDIKLVQMFYETADLKAELETYYEDNGTDKYATKAGVDTSSLIHKIITKIKEFIQKIIKGLHEFGETIVRKIESGRVKAIVAKRMRGVRGKVRAVTRDKEYRRFVDGVTKINMKGISEMRKTYDSYMSHKISYEKFKSHMHEIDDNMARSTNALLKAMGDKKVFELDETAGTPMDVEELGNLIVDTTMYQETMVKKCMQKAKEEQSKLEKDATERMKREKIKAHMEAADETSGTQWLNQAASVVQNVSRAMAEAERTTAGNIVRVLNAVGIVGTLTRVAGNLAFGNTRGAGAAAVIGGVDYALGNLEARAVDAGVGYYKKKKQVAKAAEAKQKEMQTEYESFDDEICDILGVNDYYSDEIYESTTDLSNDDFFTSYVY